MYNKMGYNIIFKEDDIKHPELIAIQKHTVDKYDDEYMDDV